MTNSLDALLESVDASVETSESGIEATTEAISTTIEQASTGADLAKVVDQVVTTYEVAAEPVVTAPVAATATQQPTDTKHHVNKKEIAARVYVKMHAEGAPRKDVIAAMISEAGLTYSGASTYYQNFKSGVMSTANVKPKVEAPDFTVMDLDEMLAFYNQYAEVKLHGFATREDALAMINAYVLN